MSILGAHIKGIREGLQARHTGFSIRAVAKRIGIHHSYLSKLERGERAPLSEQRIAALARDLGQDEHLLLALAGSLPERVSRLIGRNPELYLDFLSRLERDAGADKGRGSYAQGLEHRKNELEELNRLLRDEIAARQELERRLTEQDAEKRLILSGMAGAIITYLAPDLTMLWVSPTVLDLLQRPAGQVLGRTCYSMHHGLDAPCQDCAVLRAFATGQPQESELNRPDGTVWRVRNIPIKDENGHVYRVVRFGFDITDMHKERIALRASEERWRLAVESSSEGLWEWNAVTEKVFYSTQWKAMLGYAEHEIGGSMQEWLSLVHPEDREDVLKNRQLFLGQHTTYETRYRLRCRDGSYAEVVSRGLILRDGEGRPLRVIGTHRLAKDMGDPL